MLSTLNRTRKAACYVLAILFIIIMSRAYWNRPSLVTCGNFRDDAALNLMRKEMRESQRNNSRIPTIYIITPTYGRPAQMADLTRLSSTLMLVENIVWIVAEDSDEHNPFVSDLLKYSGIPYVYVVAKMPKKYRAKSRRRKTTRVLSKKQKEREQEQIKLEPRGVSGRLAGIKWVREHALDGVIYFADDDNSYDIRIFEEMRWTHGVSMWPVGLVTSTMLSTPVLQDGKWIDWFDGWIVDRKFPVDMAGFGVSVKLLKKVPEATMPYKAGYEEDGFLQSLGILPENIEFKADNCTKVYVWHTQTKVKHTVTKHDLENSKYDSTNLSILKKSMVFDS